MARGSSGRRGSGRKSTKRSTKRSTPRRTLTKAGRTRRAGRKRMFGTADTRKYTPRMIRLARRAGYLPGKNATRSGRGGRAFLSAKAKSQKRKPKGTGGGQFTK